MGADGAADAKSPAVIDVAELYRAEARGLYRFALFLSGDPAVADDLVAETFIRLWTARQRIDLATVRGYLFTIARNLFLHQRRDRRQSAAVDEELPDHGPGPEARAVARDELRTTLAALQQLPEIDRAALLMRADDGLSYEEIAAALALSVGAARVKVHRARIKLATARSAVPAKSLLEHPVQEAQR